MCLNRSGNRGRYDRGGRQPPHPHHHHHSHQHQQQGGGGWRGHHGADVDSAGYDLPLRPSFHGRGGGARRGGRGHQDEKPFDRHLNQESDVKPTEHRDPSVQEDNLPAENENNNQRGRGFRARNHHRPRRN
ncbi:unnamed protein product [Phytomonas sp. EM1]|nr:unnamed protein product [Phytomonas sp. EM1]|eukprot:CCW60929.1 unnamed protein product [Phytomonas sp. isolate EM1]